MKPVKGLPITRRSASGLSRISLEARLLVGCYGDLAPPDFAKTPGHEAHQESPAKTERDEHPQVFGIHAAMKMEAIDEEHCHQTKSAPPQYAPKQGIPQHTFDSA